MGPDRAADSIRKALSMGADKAIHVSDPALHGSCAMQTAKVLAKALGTTEWDLVVAGSESTDARLSIVPALLAEATRGDPVDPRAQGHRRRLDASRSSARPTAVTTR